VARRGPRRGADTDVPPLLDHTVVDPDDVERDPLEADWERVCVERPPAPELGREADPELGREPAPER
jgi:hypothetical protein